MGQSFSKRKSNNLQTVQPPPFEKYGRAIVISFIAQIEKSFNKTIVIPDEIMILCFKFYQIEHNIYLMDHTAVNLRRDTPIPLFVSVMDGQQNWKINATPLYDTKIVESCPELIHYKPGVQLPAKISADVSDKYGYQNKIVNIYDVIFAATENITSCIIMDPAQFNNKNETVTAYSWELPQNDLIPNVRPDNGLGDTESIGSSIFSSKHGLIQFNKVYQDLVAGNDDRCEHKCAVLDIWDSFKWESIDSPLNNYSPPVRVPRTYYPSRLPLNMLETRDNDEKLMVIGKKNMELYDFKECKWSDNEFTVRKKGRFDTMGDAIATCFDKRFERLYVERRDSKVFHRTYCYDLEKACIYGLAQKPVLYQNWLAMVLFQKYDLLFCVNGIMNPIQYLDLREDGDKWKVIDKPFSSLIQKYGASHRLIVSSNGHFSGGIYKRD